LCEFLQQKWNKKMLILSTFTSDYLQPLLQDLLKKFTSESINIKYVNKNLIGELLNLKSNLEEKKSYVILFRISDFLETSLSIDETKLKEHLDLTVNQIISLKQEKELPCLVFLCPSSSTVYGNNPTLESIEKKFIERLNENKIHTLTLSNIKETYGDIEFENPIEDDTHIPYTPEFYTAIACLLARKLHAIIQKPFKVIAVDCDNTLWTGAAVDDGAEGIVFKEHNILLQKYLVKQQEKGILISLCSRNAKEQTVLEVFEERQADMFLKLDHITAYKINEKFKSENIKELAVDLNVFPDSFRFIDDNPTEIYDVSQIPGVLCITMPQKLEECKSHWAFDIDEHSLVTETDKNRFELLKQAEIKTALATQFHDPIEYLRSSELSQSISISKIDLEEKVAIERVSQLSGKTNQFNLFPETKGKEISEINEMIASNKKEVFIGRIKDNFSPKDITAIALCSIERNGITINNFFVSCRSFNRGMEYELLKGIAQFAQEKHLKSINIKFKKSKKNKAASTFLNILSEKTNKYPIYRFLFNKSENFTWIQSSLNFLFKKLNICLDFSSLELDKEFMLPVSVSKLIELELDSLVRASLNTEQGSVKEQQNKTNTFDSNDKISEKYLIELKEMTGSLDYLLNKFFMNNKFIKSIFELENRVNIVCNSLLGEEGQGKSLVARGLDSLKATELRYYLYESDGINITIPKLLCEKTTAFSLIEYIREKKKSPEKHSQNDNYYNQTLPISFQQQRIWFAEQKEQVFNSASYHMTACYKVSDLDTDRFKIACQELIKLYDVFGASFFMQGDTLKQSILAPEDRRLNFQVKNLESGKSLQEAIQFEISKPWTMESEAPLIRFVIFEDSKNYHIFIHVHHAIFDAVSLNHCLDTLSKLYQNILISNSSELMGYPPQYIEFIHDQQKKLADEAYQIKALNFWRSELATIETVTALPTDQILSIFKPVTQLTARRYSFSLLSDELSKLKSLAQSNHVTCFSVLSALFGFLISSYTYQKNITLVTATNGRGGHPSFEKMVGFFVNLLVQQFDLEENQQFIAYFKQVNEKLLASQAFQEIPFNKIQEILSDQGVKDILSSPAFIYQSYAIPKLNLNNETAELEIPEKPIIFDKRETCRFGNFTLFAQENQQELSFVIEYAQDLFTVPFIEAIAKNFLHTIQNVCHNPNQKLKDISMVCDEERNILMNFGQGPKLNYAENDNLAKRFQRSVESYPEHYALFYNETRLSYREVDRQSTNLAHALIQKGVKQSDHVGIYLEANHLFFIAELAVLKLGAVFIPLSKDDPYERLKSIIEDAKIKFFIVDAERKGLFDTGFQANQLISIDSTDCINSNYLIPLDRTMEDSVCILYTSGSTGRPKGVILLEKGIFRVVESPKFVKVVPEDKIAQTANQVFDAAQLECWLAWNNGACLVVFDKKTILNTPSLQSKLAAEKITHMWLTAGLFNIHANIQSDLFNDLKYLMVGGDIVYKDTILKILKHKKAPTIINGYGPTETSIFALTHTFNKQALNKFVTSPIGAPINNTEVQILTPWGSLAPFGAIGELVIRGAGVAKGYLNLSQLEDVRFISDLKSRKYLSGDLVQYDRESEQIMFVGRANEQQVKISGNLVSLAEVRNCLSQHLAIKQVEIIIKEIKGINRLIVFYTLNEVIPKPTTKELRQYLNEKLPSYMIPSFYCLIDDFLTNANGKLDKRQFDKYEFLKKDSANTKEIVGDEKTILEIVKEELVGFPDNVEASFSDWGLNSLQAVSLTSKINDVFYLRGLKLTSADLQTSPTIELLTSLIKKPRVDTEKSILRLLKKGDPNLATIVFIHPAGGGISCFNKLIEQFKCGNPCYGIEDPLLHSNQLNLLSLEQMARNYYHEITDKFKASIVLAGFSFGGLLAWEVAKLFEDKAENNNLLRLFLFDTWVVSCASEKNKTRLIKDVLVYCAKQREKANIGGNSSEMVASLKKLCEHHQEIGFKSTPKTLYRTPVYLYKATNLDAKFSEMNAQDENNFLLKFIDSELFKKIEIDATHYDLLENSANNFLANNFSNHIGEIVHKKLSKKYSNPDNVCNVTFFYRPLTEVNSDLKFSLCKKS
jgi:amino acid adenylation domain-containing protein/FkbH-like protein